MRPISTRVNKPENDDPPIAEPIQFSTDTAYRPHQVSGLQ
jgi:hypothetical protein